MNKKQGIVFFSVFGILACYHLYLQNDAIALLMLAIIGLGILVLLFPTAHFSAKTERLLSYPEEEENEESNNENNEPQKKTYLTYYGDELDFTDEALNAILLKRLPFFKPLNEANRKKFLHRLNKFLAEKTFYIHDESGFKEMPVLISATAIQLSFGLDKYLLPSFEKIHIYPEEFVGIHSNFRILEGNVSDNCVNLSWKHFLKGFQFPEDGQNVGLHEFAHAYYFQYFETGESVDKKFVSAYPEFNNHCNDVVAHEQRPGNDLYTDYGLTNVQEFWAESVELFFEKPVQLKSRYPILYDALIKIWNQDPSNERNYWY